MTRNVDERPRREAERWFAKRLDPSVAAAEREAFERWREQNPEGGRAYEDTENLWDRLAVLKESQRLRAAVSHPAPGALPRKTPMQLIRGRLPSILALAASLTALAVLLLFWRHGNEPDHTFATGLGEQRTETLADGTALRLNTSSTLDVQMTSRRRSATLRSGEAAFDVAKDTKRPFVVTVGDGTITAIGTHFQVRREGSTVAVTLLEGRVRLARQSRRELEWLNPGQQAVFSEAQSGIVRRNVDVAALTSWMSGRLEFRGTPLQVAVSEVNRYSARKLRIGDPSIEALSVSGTFRTGDVDAVAAAFEAAFPISAQSGEKEIILFARK